jgi:hypothetical protein
MAYYTPKRNEPLPYGERHFPFRQRAGARIWPNGARIAFVGYAALEQWDWNQCPASVWLCQALPRPTAGARR